MAESYNLDDQLSEYFEFIVQGHTYRFRHLNTEEMEKMKTFDSDSDKANEYIFSFITKLDDSSPEFPDIAKKMITPQWRRFRDMLVSEFSGNGTT